MFLSPFIPKNHTLGYLVKQRSKAELVTMVYDKVISLYKPELTKIERTRNVEDKEIDLPYFISERNPDMKTPKWSACISLENAIEFKYSHNNKIIDWGTAYCIHAAVRYYASKAKKTRKPLFTDEESFEGVRFTFLPSNYDDFMNLIKGDIRPVYKFIGHSLARTDTFAPKINYNRICVLPRPDSVQSEHNTEKDFPEVYDD